MSTVRQYSTFFADQFHFAIGVDHVQEVLQPMAATAVPLTSGVIDGLVNLRGQIVTAVDLRTRLNLPPRAEEASVSLIVRTNSGLISLRADRLGDVLDRDTMTPSHSKLNTGSDWELPKDAATAPLESLPDTVQGPIREVVQGIIQLEDSLLLVLEPDQLLTAEVSLQLSEKDS